MRGTKFLKKEKILNIDKIKQFALETDLTYLGKDGRLYFNNCSRDNPEAYLEKFAELIVRECIATIEPLAQDVELNRAEWTALGIIEEAQIRIAERFELKID